MASMAHGYGLPRRWREAALRACCTIFMFLAASGAFAAPLRLLVLGDSLTAGYGLASADGFQARLAEALRAAGRDVVLIDAAVSGDTTAGGRARLAWALTDGADAAIVALGGNDGLRGIDPKNTEANLAAILNALAAAKIPVLLAGMLAPPNLGPDYGTAFRDGFARVGARPGVIFDTFLLEGVAGTPGLNQADGIHPNPEGVRREIARLLPLVLRLLDAVHK